MRSNHAELLILSDKFKTQVNNTVQEYKSLRDLAEILVAQLKDANTVIEDFILAETHAPFCRAVPRHYGEQCTCMDKEYYNIDSNVIRAKAYIEKWGVE